MQSRLLVESLKPMSTRRGDADNIPKAVCDLLVAQGVIQDDSLVRTLTTTWASTDNVAPVA
jgi:Holliday junction resolvase RusA-like endonuclease